MLICRNAQGVHGHRKSGNPWPRDSPFDLVHSSIAATNSPLGLYMEHYFPISQAGAKTFDQKRAYFRKWVSMYAYSWCVGELPLQPFLYRTLHQSRRHGLFWRA